MEEEKPIGIHGKKLICLDFNNVFPLIKKISGFNYHRVTCEEFSSGQVHEVDPFTGLSSQQQTVLGNSGGKYESFAYDARNLAAPTFYGK